MKPYFEEDGITIYHGDCREVLPDFPEATVITDPPYNIGYPYDTYRDSLSDEHYRELLMQTLRPPSVVLHYPEDMFGVYSALGCLPEKCVAWTYNAHTPRKWRMIAWFCSIPQFQLIRQPFKNPDDRRIMAKLDRGEEGCSLYDWWHDEQVKNVSDEKTEHPCQIPLEIMKKVVGITIANLVVDPFMGSGTTLRAAKDLGRRAIGIEIEEKYCEIAAKRLAQKVFEF